MASKNKERLSQEDIKARLMFLIGSVLAIVFLVVTLGSLGGVLASNGLKDKPKSEYEKTIERRLSGNDTP